MRYFTLLPARQIDNYYSFIIFAELEMHWSDMIMVFIATETAVTLSGDFPVNKEKTLRRGVMKGN